MAIDTTSSLLKEQQILRSRVTTLEKEKEFIKKLYADIPQMLLAVTKGAPLSALLNRFKDKLQTQLPNTYCLFIVCDKDCTQWRLQYTDSINDKLLNSNGQLVTLPQALVSFAAKSSCLKRHDADIQNSADWGLWRTFLDAHSFSDVSMVSVPDGRGLIYLMASFQRKETYLDESLISLALDHYVAWVDAAFEREKADFLLLEESHKDSETGLLRRYSFENSFNIVLKDSRRHFQRAALLSLRLLSNDKIESAELKVLAEVMQDVVRDNDLMARYDERQLVMGIRISHLEDAEVVAAKLLESIQKPEYATNRLIRAGLAIGISFYPEHSTLDSLEQAAFLAANSLKNVTGYRIEFHDAFYSSSSECYSL
ncbi:diguanylate cyclase [Marinomonas ushuaiensis DSM 15871]|uniref:Diguanylate cyclase n=1 Tax=Marinomonas ushuaiensis DSM 15871 TaxID=1122207 RepID=X7E8R0_9GAMM|nr:diguanylate cyclase [Marinomonas ushuaiensis]ETX12439.1 diguanylate cyclase [Marinomonas ushuaiensis DSM 15871]